MGNWKTTLKVEDLAEDQRLEMVCRQCRRVTYTSRTMICEVKLYSPEGERVDLSQKYLDEIERMARCKAKACRGHMRMSMVRLKEVSGFVGGLA